MFKVGDKVRCVNAAYGLREGDTYTIALVEGHDLVGVVELWDGVANFSPDRFVHIQEKPRHRVWCGLCGSWVNEGDVFPCVECDTMPTHCGAIGAPAELIPEEEVQLDMFTAQKQHHQNAPSAPQKALDVQIGGNHYNKLKIQPFEYSLANGLGPAEHTAIKYLTRWKDKGGVKDLDKAIHTIQILKDWAVNNGFS